MMGVDIFFAISGLLITERLLNEYRTGGQIDLRAFYIRRAFRILPPALLYLGVAAVLRLFVSKMDVFSCLAFWRNYLSEVSLYAGHFWSLSLEEQFYAVWPLALVTLGLRRIRTFAFALIALVVVWRTLSFSLTSPWNDYTHTDLRCDGLLWGCLAALAMYHGSRIEVSRIVFWACAIGSYILFFLPVAVSFVPGMIIAAVLGTVQHPGWSVSKILESKPLVWIGQRSYGIYLWQQLFIFYGDLHLPFWLSISVRLTALLIFAEISYVLLERPLQNLGRRLAGRKRELVMSAAIA
jgi:peptidoglycan/LPS O-acetylase OafA/YrhL